jgi:hypothetical protein
LQVAAFDQCRAREFNAPLAIFISVPQSMPTG